MQRIKLYSQISTCLSVLSNEKLKQILADGKPMHEGIGGKSALIYINASTGEIQTLSVNVSPILVKHPRTLLYFLNMFHKICMIG